MGRSRMVFRNHRRKQQSPLLFCFAVLSVCCIIVDFLGGPITHRRCAPTSAKHVNAFVALDTVRRENAAKRTERIATTRAKAPTIGAVLRHQCRRVRTECGVFMKEQPCDDAEIIRNTFDTTNTILLSSWPPKGSAPVVTDNIAASTTTTTTTTTPTTTRRRFLTAAGTVTGFLATIPMVPSLNPIASAASSGIDPTPTSTVTAATAFEYTENNRTAITVPLAFTGQELLISYKVDDSLFKAVLDTGSPFLMIPGSCGRNTRQKSGCYQNQGAPVPKLTPTIEIFDGFEGEVQWRSAPFEFWDVNKIGSSDDGVSASVPQEKQQPLLSTDTENKNKDVIFGVASEAIMGGPGGVFFGMIRDSDTRIRPSFLGQTDVRAFRVNLATRPRTLTLSNRDLIATGTSKNNNNDGNGDQAETDATPVVADYIPMTNILRRRYGDPVGHYTAIAQSIYVNGYPLVDTTIEKYSKIMVIFDTGVTGMVVSRGLFDEQYILARQRREKTLFGNVELTFSTALGKETTLRANKPLATPFDPDQTWKKFPKSREGKKSTTHIIVMGLAFLEDRSLTVDIDEDRIWVE